MSETKGLKINFTGIEFYDLFFDILVENDEFEVSLEGLEKINKFWVNNLKRKEIFDQITRIAVDGQKELQYTGHTRNGKLIVLNPIYCMCIVALLKA